MTTIKQVFRIYSLMVFERISQPRMYISFALGIVFFLVPAMNLYRYAIDLNEYINISEIFIVSMNSQHNLVFFMLGFFLLLSDAPFLSNRITHVFVRISRNTWLIAQLFYIFISSAIYVIMVTFIVSIAFIGICYAPNVWSNPIQLLAANPSFAIQYGISFHGAELISKYLPWQALALNLLLVTLYGTVIGFLLFTFSIFRYRLLGFIVSMGIHVTGYMILRDAPYHANPQLSLLVRSIPSYQFYGYPFPSTPNSMFTFIILIVTLVTICFQQAKKIDLCNTVGEEL